MRRSLVALLSLVAVALLSAPAGAQESGLRDPFDPLLSVEGVEDDTTDTSDTTDTVDTSDTTTTTDEDPEPTDGLPSTGADPRSWLAVAYVLVAAGATLLAVTRRPRLPSKLR